MVFEALGSDGIVDDDLFCLLWREDEAFSSLPLRVMVEEKHFVEWEKEGGGICQGTEIPSGDPDTLYPGDGAQWVEHGSLAHFLGSWEHRGFPSFGGEGFVGSGMSTEDEDRSGDSGG